MKRDMIKEFYENLNNAIVNGKKQGKIMSIISMIDDIVSQLVDLQHDLEKLAESDKGEL